MRSEFSFKKTNSKRLGLTITPLARTTTRTHSKMSIERCIDCRQRRQFVTAWGTEGVTAEVCDGYLKMNCAIERHAPT